MCAGSEVRISISSRALGRRQARGGLVEQDEARRAGERERDLELALLAVGELGDLAVPDRGQMHRLRQVDRPRALSASSAPGRSNENRPRETPRQAR